MKKILMSLTILSVLSLVLVAGCSNGANSEVVQQEVMEKEETTAGSIRTETSQVVSNVREFDVIAKQFAFEPATITVKQGDKVLLHVTSQDVDHGFALPTFGVSQRIAAGETKDIEFVADKTGTFSFFCNVQCGSGHGGMRGQLIVE